MSGFFCALITKHRAMEANHEPPPNRDFSTTHLEPLKNDIETQIHDQVETNYGLALENILEAFNLELFQRFDQLFLIPQKYTEHFSTLPYEYIGMPLGQWHQDTLIPSHAFASRFGTKFTRGKIIIEESHVEMWISGRDIRHPQTELTPKGQYLLVNDQDGRNLGIGKLLPKRLRNMLPRGLI
jgi:NOL1/NOP2/fmu family ribosome biogenesis protein